MKAIFILFFCLFTINAFAQTDTTQHIDPTRRNSKAQQQKPYVIMISADGFRYDYAKKYNATHLLALSGKGVAAESMIPSYPSVTFPNHYTLVTGLYPSHHGLVANQFWDAALGRRYSMKGSTVTESVWYGGTPLWVLAEQQKMLSANFYWVGSEAAEKGILPTYYYSYNDLIGIHERLQIIKNWLTLPADKRPHFIAVYFPEVDHEGHTKGPDAPETEHAVHFIDSAVYELTKMVKSTGLNVNFVFVADHGMARVDNVNPIQIPAVIDTNKYVISTEGVLANVYAKKGAGVNINDTYQAILKEAKDYTVYLKADVPANLNYGVADDKYGRIGDMVLIPNYPKVFGTKGKKINPATHGYNPYLVKEMHATFFAWGPAFKSGLTIPSFQNVNVYPIVTKILGLKYTEKIDGTPAVANKILKATK